MSEVPSHRLKRAKRALRTQVLAARDALAPAARAARSEAITQRFLTLPELDGAATVMVFWSFGSEVDTAALIAHLARGGRHLALPRIEGPEVVPVAYRPGDALQATSFGAREPTDGRILAPETLDLVVVPGVAFDRQGRRVGYGGGFYDRLLPRVRDVAPPVAIAFALQVVPEVPAGRADRRIDVVVTEHETIRCR